MPVESVDEELDCQKRCQARLQLYEQMYEQLYAVKECQSGSLRGKEAFFPAVFAVVDAHVQQCAHHMWEIYALMNEEILRGQRRDCRRLEVQKIEQRVHQEQQEILTIFFARKAKG